ncbi:MAG: hypothetical protein WD533_02985, partial [Dehalococcoidia bacterium]
KVLSECHRVLASTGQLVFTDVLVRRDTPQADRERIYDRVKSPDMWDMDDYLKGLANAGFNVTRTTDWSEHVAGSYGWVRDRLREHRDALSARIPLETIDRTIEALSFWVDSANKGNIGWALYVANKAK